MFAHKKTLIGTLFIFTILSTPLRADERANEILKKVENIFTSDSTEIKMKIQEPDGSLKERTLLFKRKKDGEAKVLIKILSPTDLKGTGLLGIVQKDGSVKQWFFSPSEKASRKLSAANKKDRFADSEFNFEDLGFSLYKNFSNSVIETKKEGLSTVALVESTLKNSEDTGYSKIKTWVDLTNNRILKAEYYDEDSLLLKVLTLNQYKQYEKIWLPQNISLNNVKKNRLTTLQILSSKAKKMTDNEFSISALEER